MDREKVIIYWQRREFRFKDNPALFEAAKFARENHLKFCPLFALDTNILNGVQGSVGYPRRFALANLLTQWQYIWAEKFGKNKNKNSPFIIFDASPEVFFTEAVKHYDVELFINEDVDPYALKRDEQVQKLVQNLHIFSDQLTINKNIKTTAGNVYTVFTPFMKTVWDEFLNAKVYEEPDFKNINFTDLPDIKIENFNTLQNPEKLKEKVYDNWVFKVKSEGGEKEINLNELIERPDLSGWYFEEKEVQNVFQDFFKNRLKNYGEGRNDLGEENGVSHMSMALKWGLISPRYIKNQILESGGGILNGGTGASKYIAELIWREFYKYILYHFPNILEREYQEKRLDLNWDYSKKALENFKLWIVGKTGFDIVDAAMNEIKKTGWMHNRTRMVVASFLTKNLQIDWRWGQEYFRNILIDLDDASNNGGWQWAASTGVDPKPIRIFNPFLQGERYDESGVYRTRWLGEGWQEKYFTFKELEILEKENAKNKNKTPILENKFKDKIKPIVDYKTSRQNALSMFGLNKSK